MKKKVLYSVIGVLFLVICYIIGQTVVKPNRKGVIDVDKKIYFYDYTKKDAELVYEGLKETSDMPGGKTVGLIEDDVYGKWYLISPNTSITAGIILDDVERELTFNYCIHKDVVSLSDGINLKVRIIAEGSDEVLYENTLDAGEEEKGYSVDLRKWKNSNIFITLQAENMSEDETGDWLVIKDAVID